MFWGGFFVENGKFESHFGTIRNPKGHPKSHIFGQVVV
jgi:hypothetical protein